MNYSLVTIATPGANQGNLLIEKSLNKVLDLPAPKYAFSMFSRLSDEDIDKINSTDFVLCAGSTIFAKASGNSDALADFGKVSVPKFCASASGWSPKFPVYKEALKLFDGPIGARDPHIAGVCKELGKEHIFTGCPTAYLPLENELRREDLCIVGYGRENSGTQLKVFREFGKKFKLFSSIQESGYCGKLAETLGVLSFSYSRYEQAYKNYRKATLVVTGRLHGVLPALSQRTPVLFFGDNRDSRFTLLSYLGVPTFSLTADLPSMAKSSLEDLFYLARKPYSTVTEDGDFDARIGKIKNGLFEWKRLIFGKDY